MYTISDWVYMVYGTGVLTLICFGMRQQRRVMIDIISSSKVDTFQVCQWNSCTYLKNRK